MALSDGPASTQQVEQALLRAKQREEARLRAIAIQKAKESEPKVIIQDDGIAWTYVVLDESEVRLESCALPSDAASATSDQAASGQAMSGQAAPGKAITSQATSGQAISGHATSDQTTSDQTISGQDAVEESGPALALEIPDIVDGLPVVALAAECCKQLEGVESISIPDSVVSIGNCAFWDCGDLRSIRFPSELGQFDPQWLRGCHRVEEIMLPGAMEKLTSRVFEFPNLRKLGIGPDMQDVMPGACLNSHLESISVSPQNASLQTDGYALYKGTTMSTLAVPLEHYSVAAGTKTIDRKAFNNFAAVKRVDLPDSVETIEPFAYSKTGITGFTAPASLKTIGERAFFACTELREVDLNEGLESIGDNAFTDTAIAELDIPSTVFELGNPIAANTPLVFSGKDATFRVSEDSHHLLLAEDGSLYARTDDGLKLIRMLDPSANVIEVREGTVEIADDALHKHPSVERVILPESLRRIGARAFKDVHTLTEVSLPTNLQEIGEEAFLGTEIGAISIPAALRRLGARALVTEGALHGTKEPALKEISVDGANSRFRMEGSMLIERLDNGNDRVVICTGTYPDVSIPCTVTAISPYAFSGLRRLKSMELSDAIVTIDTKGLGFDSLLEHIHINLTEPIEGHNSLDIDFPNTTRAAQQMMLAFTSTPYVNVELILEHYDNSIVNASGFDASTEKALDSYEQAWRILERLEDPVLMTPVNRNIADKVLKNHLIEFCVEIARHDDKHLIDDLIEFGYLDEGNIGEAIEAVGRIQDASITNHLLEAKRRMQGSAPVDFESEFEL